MLNFFKENITQEYSYESVYIYPMEIIESLQSKSIT